MIIADDWVWLHIPKTGGTAMERILLENFKHRKDVKFDDLHDLSTVIWHQTLAERQISTPEQCLKNRTVHANIRRLPTWLLSRIHFELQRHGPRAIFIREHMVQGKFKVVNWRTGDKSRDKLFHADRVIETCSPDVTNWIRMENMQEDIEKAFGIKGQDELISRRTNDTTLQYVKNPRFWFTKEELAMIYDANPIWAGIERAVYGDLLTN